jgi:hypothetical protein
MTPLTSEQVASYHENGYLLLRASEHQLVDPTALLQWTKEVQAWPRVKGKWMPYDEININGERQLMRTEKFIDYHPEFKSLVCGEKLAEILKAVSGDVSISMLPTCNEMGLLTLVFNPGHASIQGQNQLQAAPGQRLPGSLGCTSLRPHWPHRARHSKHSY